MFKALLDTNILVDMAFRGRPDHEAAREVFRRAEQGQLSLACGADSLAVFANSAGRHYATREQVQSVLRGLVELLEVVPLDARLISSALDLDEPDLDDQIVHASFLACGADVLVSRDAEAFEGLAKVAAPRLLGMLGACER